MDSNLFKIKGYDLWQKYNVSGTDKFVFSALFFLQFLTKIF